MKDDEFILGVLDTVTEHESHKISQVYRITSGDPSRGALALESELAPSPGTTVQVGVTPLAPTCAYCATDLPLAG